MSYDPALTLLSFALAVGATWGAFFSAARERSGGALVMLAGAFMGAGICLMHYVGMAALRTAVSLGYDPLLVALSLLIAVAAATAALFAARRERALAWRAAAATILGAAIAGMHYTAMAALELTPGPDAIAAGAPPYVLAGGVAAATLLVLFLALLASLYDQRLNVMSALEAGGVGYWELALPQMTLHVSPRGKALFGRDPQAPFGLADLTDLFPPGDQARRTRLEAAAAAGEEYDMELRVRGRDGEARWVNIRGRVIAEAGDRARRMVGVVFDITERQEAFAQVAESDRRQRLLIDELNHRVKNTLAAVQSISRQSALRAGSLDDFRELFEARLIALSQTHNTLTRRSWERAHLEELLEQQLSPHPQDRVQLAGPHVDLAPREALALGMVFHELATNAARYGALSAHDGRVRVDWETIPGGGGAQLVLEWIERGGPQVTPPARRGFGTRMVQGAVTGELGGSAELTFAPEGFRARLSMPLDLVQDGRPDEPKLKLGVQDGFSPGSVSSKRWTT